ncbi:non-oxidative hydroxyarylic acid decarboxylases subunit B [Rhizobium sp. RM]|uniref:non-oxidative hydroxyarylic acid decarboxylases subunit B n=1 Tax=Rhizobium sp. RM TaxID=2748079 RepID=UPI00110DD198|nr:non-oxidative hydroxyarylic acid decarboxylases subunit B [Rhizobium sp. RM]NWJ25447.1 UbiX family flavin prenyltransferase [Rhizobium sp. RM]TMV22079.1 UbiX family flavin prenyltransferase [Rhizobium sp. Td3]
MKIVVGITGATGAILGIRVLEALRMLGVETHLIVSKWARVTIQTETPHSLEHVLSLADKVYNERDQAAAVSSGSFRTNGMIIVPCSMKTLAAIRSGFAEDLIARAADVVLKERRRLVLVPREAPLNAIHLENMLALTNAGAQMLPPMPAFYNHPKSIDDIIDHVVSRILDQFDLDNDLTKRWQGSLNLSKEKA